MKILNWYLEASPLGEQKSLFGKIIWWEKRRPLFNLAVFLSGIITLFCVLTMVSIYDSKVGETFDWEPIIIPLYAILANICYSFGWLLDLIYWRKMNFHPRVKWIKYGTYFSIGLTLLPIPLTAIGMVYQILKRH